MNVEFVKTTMTSDTSYVDLLLVDGKPHTFHMIKTSDPNNYGVDEQTEGDKFADFVEKYKK